MSKRVFIAHAFEDLPFCRALAHALQSAGADVWYAESSAGPHPVISTITEEIQARPIFVVTLSKPTLHSRWVLAECLMAFNHWINDPDRIILPVVVAPISYEDFGNLGFLTLFNRVEQPDYQPCPPDAAIERVLTMLGLAEARATTDVLPAQLVTADELIARARASQESGEVDDAIKHYREALALRPKDSGTWVALGRAFEQARRADEALAAYRQAELHAPQPQLRADIIKRYIAPLLDAMEKPGEAEQARRRANAIWSAASR